MTNFFTFFFFFLIPWKELEMLPNPFSTMSEKRKFLYSHRIEVFFWTMFYRLILMKIGRNFGRQISQCSCTFFGGPCSTVPMKISDILSSHYFYFGINSKVRSNTTSRKKKSLGESLQKFCLVELNSYSTFFFNYEMNNLSSRLPSDRVTDWNNSLLISWISAKKKWVSLQFWLVHLW